MKVALYICLFVILFNILNSYILSYRIQFLGNLGIFYNVSIYAAFLSLSVFSAIYLVKYKNLLIVKLCLIFTNIVYLMILFVIYYTTSSDTREDINIHFSRLDKSEQIILIKYDYFVNDTDLYEVYSYNLNKNFRLLKIVDSIELNGIWIKKEFRSNKLDTINYKNFIYKSEYNN